MTGTQRFTKRSGLTVTRRTTFSGMGPNYIRDPDRYTRQRVLTEQLQSQINITSFHAVD